MTVRIRGMRSLQRKIARLSEPKKREVANATKKSAIVLHERAATYPPQRPGSSYRRTGTLGRRWTMKTKVLSARVWNKTRYGPFVMGPRSQAGVHKGRWATTAQIAREQMQKITGFYQAAIRKVLNG